MNRRSFFNRLLIGAIAIQTKPEVLCPEPEGLMAIVAGSPSFEGVTEDYFYTMNGTTITFYPHMPEGYLYYFTDDNRLKIMDRQGNYILAREIGPERSRP